MTGGEARPDNKRGARSEGRKAWRPSLFAYRGSPLVRGLILLALLSGCAAPTTPTPTLIPTTQAATPGVAATPTASPTQTQPRPTSVATPVRTPPPVERPLEDGMINLAHLQRLTEVREWGGVPVALVHIYSEAPDYGWVDASGEGIAAVDDVARAALVYLEFYERTQEQEALDLARASLNFVLALQADDGEYYNFVRDLDGAINQSGGTSLKSWGWWAARGQWALAVGIRVFREADPAYADELRAAYLKGESALEGEIGTVGEFDSRHGVDVPAWLIGNGSDVSSLAMLGLAEYYAVEPNDRTAELLTALGDGVAAYQLGGPGEYPFGAHPSATTSTALWHAWGSHQVHALALAGRLLEKPEWIESARRAADGWFTQLLATDQLINEMAPLPQRGGQIAYGAQIMTTGFMALFDATGDDTYARDAGLAASWLLGNNMAGVPMYDPETGRCFDGIDGPSPQRINRNAGAESTIEALYTLLQVIDNPLASEALMYRSVPTSSTLVAEVEAGETLAGDPTYVTRDWTGEARYSGGHAYDLKEGDRVAVTVTVPAEGDYLVYASHLRRAAEESEDVAEVLRAPGPVTIDGDLDEWGGAQPLPVDTAEQVLRGGSGWPGAEQASFVLSWMWDEQNLYVSAQVKDPEHVQDNVGPAVVRGDALWLYFDTQASRRRVDVKLTLAQTPDGPQIWSWTSSSFLPGAELAWKKVEGGYTYEAALPWESLNRVEATSDRALAFEAGMGFGNAFIDWTGRDPDVASNLAPLRLVDVLSTAGSQPGETPQAEAGAVAFGVTLDGSEPTVVSQSTSPDRDYLWLDRVFEGAVSLTAGEHRVELTYAGQQLDAAAEIDALVFVPAVVCRDFEKPAGGVLRLCYDMQTGQGTWQDR